MRSLEAVLELSWGGLHAWAPQQIPGGPVSFLIFIRNSEVALCVCVCLEGEGLVGWATVVESCGGAHFSNGLN